ncbi:MAG: nucleotidyl transferase AbiEii/AbiGii toxin family protein [Candidatus Nanoarchaeia archaeon]|nr:nucleotidyl transferase AbiEii/AbiGii toxin family protein [Candidatus Nanoarchaeia archaeon]
MVFKNRQLTQDELNSIIVEKKFQRDLLVKDYYITILLYLMKDIKGIYFKGGTALQLTLLNHARISEDIDFTLTRELKDVRNDIEETINETNLFGKITQDKDVEGFVRLIVPYKTLFGTNQIFIDLNKRGKLFLEPEVLEMTHFYPNIPEFKFPCLNRTEMVAEKIAASIGRNKPRDHYDIYQLIKHKVKFDMNLVEKKCVHSGHEYSILKMFNRAKKLHKRWNEDMIPLLVDEVSFEEVMKTISKHFNLKDEKEQLTS